LTKNRKNNLHKKNRDKLLRYIQGILKNKKCVLYEINGTENQLHLATHVHPTIAVSSLWIKENNVFLGYNVWLEEYSAFTYSIKEKNAWVK